MMDSRFHYSAAEYHEQVAHIARQVVSNEDALPTVTPRIDVESNSYHGTAIKEAERKRLSELYPRLYL